LVLESFDPSVTHSKIKIKNISEKVYFFYNSCIDNTVSLFSFHIVLHMKETFGNIYFTLK